MEASVVVPDQPRRGTDPAFPEVREAPTLQPGRPPVDPAFPDASAEPELAVNDIQGNVLAGFNKDFQTLLFLEITDPAAFKAWLADLIPSVATVAEVLAFNRLFKLLRDRRGYEGTVKSTWLNLALSADGLRKLTSGEDVDRFHDDAFKGGLDASRSTALGDPSTGAEGNIDNWVVGGPQRPVDILIIAAADERDDLDAEVARLEELIYAPRRGGAPVRSGVQVTYKQHGSTLPGSLRGHEHFGWLDGVSQPGIRGRMSADPHDVLTPRQNPTDRNQGKPGQDLLWPGEFVFGYPGQDAAKSVEQPSDNPVVAGDQLDWAVNGSFLVFRRLRQDVHAFHRFLFDQAKNLGIGPGQLGSRLVGRWQSGAPIMRTPDQDLPPLADDDCANNHFEFHEPSRAISAADKQSSIDCEDDQYPSAGADDSGAVCPLAAHIRKSYPRDDQPIGQDNPYAQDQAARRLNEQDTQTHRLLRRGIPYGPPSRSTPVSPVDDSIDRGLLFMAYQTSIVEQFEFVTQQWVNDPNFKAQGAGPDPVLGQATGGGDRTRTFKVILGGEEHELTAPSDFVIATGGLYLFAPSISGLQHLAGVPGQ